MAKFLTSARAVDMLGRQQIAGIPTAISELFKNAYDAYARSVRADYFPDRRLLVLRDDGVGIPEGQTPMPGHIGLDLLQALARQLRGTLSFHNEGGARVCLSFEEGGS